MIVYSRLLMLDGRLHDAELLLQRLLSFTEGEDRLHSMVEILNLLAMRAYKNNDMRGAMNHFEKSLAIGMKEGYVRSYMDELAPMADLLRYYTMRGKKRTGHPAAMELTAYARNLLIQTQESLPIAKAAFSEAAVIRTKEHLTVQEKQVMKLLFEANTNQEISKKLGISLTTVKTHTGNIYGKLGVKNRAQCMKLIREARLLE